MHRSLARLALILASATVLIVGGCRSSKTSNADDSQQTVESEKQAQEQTRAAVGEGETVCDKGQSVATFAGGCFWCMEPPFDKLDGVKQTIVGYAGGTTPDPTYKQVAGGRTDHAETIQICYDDSVVSYDTLLEIFWRRIDPTQKNGQFVDIGSQYRTIIFFHSDEQKQEATSSKQQLADHGPFDEPIVTTIEPYTGFWKAKDYHQNFYQTHPERYHSYHSNSGRYEFYREHWGAKNPTEKINAKGTSSEE